ncbi:aldo-keto reductase family 1 member C15-like isoform X4 [Erinaceus europaeus]|uniref:Aldo-keto reductase family 1 member C15-like isoform X4 n=1 Tax=Erinaceus europaeus TaxID=9365 RepID=A0A1S3WFZ7_ERIEU|nr:aldo-keto reductase family 1 member C15-like isoform X4 [Erinaceus europaeus]
MDLKRSRCVRLSDGHHMPVLGLGTYAPEEIPKIQAYEATKMAIDAGYRHIDSAYMYQNEKELGKAIREKVADGTVKREDIFYTSKPGEEILPMDASGKILLDEEVEFCAIWEVLEKCKDAGLTKSIGVSNFNHKQLEIILNKPGLKYKPVCNQVECHPYLNQSKLLEFCKSRDIVLVAFSALGSHREKKWMNTDIPPPLEDLALKAIAQKHGRSPAQVALRYQLQRGVVVLAKSFSKKRIWENFQVFDFELTPEDMKAIDGLNTNSRLLMLSFGVHHPNYPFVEEY